MKPRPRSDAYSPKSSGWSLYNPQDVATKLNLPVETVDLALEETGFNKAVRIREEIIRWKTGLIAEQKQLHQQRQQLQDQLKKLSCREKQVEEQLVNVRNILRIPREKPEVRHEIN